MPTAVVRRRAHNLRRRARTHEARRSLFCRVSLALLGAGGKGGAPAAGPITKVQGWSTSVSGDTATFSAATAGNTLIAIANSDSTLTDPSGWTLIASKVQQSGSYVWVKTAGGGETSVTISGAPTKTVIAVAEYSGLTITEDITESTSSTAANSATSTTGTTGSTATANTLTIAWLGLWRSNTARLRVGGATAGYTEEITAGGVDGNYGTSPNVHLDVYTRANAASGVTSSVTATNYQNTGQSVAVSCPYVGGCVVLRGA